MRCHSPQYPNSHPVRCSPTLLLHTNGSRELSFTQVPKPPPCEVFSYLAVTYKGEQGGIIHPSPQNAHPVRCSPTLLLHTTGSRELSLTQVPKPHPVRCSPTMLLHTNGSRELSLTQVPKPPHCEVFSNNAITYQQEQGGIIHPSTQTPTL